MKLRAVLLPLLGVVLACGGAPQEGYRTGVASASSKPASLVVESPPVATSQTEAYVAEPSKTREPQDEVRLCSFQQGRIMTCRNAYNGAVQLAEDGAWLNCRVTAGHVTHCLGAATGNVVVFDGSNFVTCGISSGNLVGCEGPFTGLAPLARPPIKD